MLKCFLYCDIKSLNCSAEDIEKALSDFAVSFIRVNDSIWLFKYTDTFNGYWESHESYIFNTYFEKFTTDQSLVLLSRIEDRFYYNLPEDCAYYLNSDSP